MTKARISRFWEIIRLHTIAATLCFTLVGNIAAAEQIDQSNLPQWAGGWTNINPNAEGRAVMWQTFTPAFSNLIAVDVDILTISPGKGNDTLTVEICKGENILASAERYVEDGFDGLLRFEFSEAVSLVPEQIYELMVRDTGALRFGWKYASNTYERGSRYVGAQERPGTDWLFQTYSDAKYSGGTGEPNKPYQIATADDLILLGGSPEDYDKHFVLTADIDLDPNLPGGKVFERAVIAPDTNDDVKDLFQGTPFAGVFDGNGHAISNLAISGRSYIGLFGKLESVAIVRNLGIVDASITGIYVGGLVGENYGSIYTCSTEGTVSIYGLSAGGLCHSNYGNITTSYSTAMVSGYECPAGGLVGYNYGSISSSYSTGSVYGEGAAGGLVGHNLGSITTSYSTSIVDVYEFVAGGLVGINDGSITTSYSTGAISGVEHIGGLVGYNTSDITSCYSTGSVRGTSLGGTYESDLVGGLVGENSSGDITSSFWDIETSGEPNMCGNQIDCNNIFGKTTAEMMDPNMFISAGWDFVGDVVNGPNDIWKIWDGYDYPHLAWEPGPNTPLVFVDINDPNFYGQMSKYEVTNDQYCDFLNVALASGDIALDGNDVYGAGGSNSGEDYAGQRYYRTDGSGYTGYGATNGGASRIHYNEGAFSVDEGFGNHPVTYVSWYGATAFTNYYNYYLPTEEQWQAIADYNGTYIYGCGETIDPSIANYRFSEHPDGTVPVSSFGIYGYGMSDMAGNVWEWTSSGLDSNRVFRGGGWYSLDSDCAISIRGDGIPHANYTDIGFRVCR
jgi:hypothetical protein